MRPHPFRSILFALSVGVLLGCGRAGDEPPRVDRTDARPRAEPDAEALTALLDAIDAEADSMDARLRPVPLLRIQETRTLQRNSNDEQLVFARRLGITPVEAPAAQARLEGAGRLVRLAPSTPLWTVRPLEHSAPLLTPDAHALLTEIGTRFQQRLAALGLPPLRLEVTSALRTSESQADLRRTNRNATGGESTHEYGTTLDIAYSSFRAPDVPARARTLPAAPWLDPMLRRYEVALTETVAARRSRELQAILGRVLRGLQDEGAVLVTLEREQPVYHMTVARRLRPTR